MRYRVSYANTIYEAQVQPLPSGERAEIRSHVKALERSPFPGSENRIFRVRNAKRLAPLFAARTERFIVFHRVEAHDVFIVGVFSSQV